MELTIDQTLQKGIEAHKAGQFQEADRLYTAILKAQPKHPDANHNMGVLAVGVGKIQEALPFFKTALEANPNTEQFWLSYIDGLIKLDKMADAQAVFDQAKDNGAKGEGFDQLEQRLNVPNGVPIESVVRNQEVTPKQPNILDKLKLDQALKLAKKKAKEGSLEDAKRIYQDILVKFSKNKRAIDGIKALAGGPASKASKVQDPPEDQQQLLINLYSQGQLQKALEQATVLLQQFPNSSVLYNICGAVYKGLGQLDAAVQAYKKALAIEPGYAEAHYNMGAALKEQGKLEDAIKAYNKALAIKPDYADTHYNMGAALKEQGKLDDAIEAYNKALAIKPDYADAHYNLGVTLQDQGKLEGAIDNYNKAVTINPDYADAFNNMGVTLKDQGKLDDAIEAYKKALSIKPDFAEAYNNMGNALKEQGRLEEAIECYDQVNSKPSIAKALEGLYLLGNYDEFSLRLNAIAKKDPANIRVAAMSAFAAHQRQKEDPYPFCANPIELIKFAHIKNHVSNSDGFIASILSEMNEKNAVWEPRNKTTKGGFQTGSKLFSNPSPNMKTLENIIKRELNLLRAEFKSNENVLFQKWPDEMKINAWYVRMLQNGYQNSHIHPAGWVSGVFYLKTVETPVQHEGAIEFGLHGYDYPVINEDYPRRLYEPSKGDLVLFPSSLFHKTIPVKKDVERCVIAFDLIG